MNKHDEVFKDVENYVICSTLNQVVNYLPLTMIDNWRNPSSQLSIINLTKKMKSEANSKMKRFDNPKWDENFSEYIQKKSNNMKCTIKNVELENNLSNLTKELDDTFYQQDTLTADLKNPKKLLPRKTLWNVTGGQRNLLLDIMTWVQKQQKRHGQDVIMYMEGNTQQIYYTNSNKGWEFEAFSIDYSRSDIMLDGILELAGYTTSQTSTVNYLESPISAEDEKGIMEKAYRQLNQKVHQKDTEKQGTEFVEDILQLNKKSIVLDDMLVKRGMEDEYIASINDDIKKYKENMGGYLLEKMALVATKDAIQSIHRGKEKFFTGLYHSVNIKKRGDKSKYRSDLCEFDIVITTVSGQLVIIECKAGIAPSDTLKARMYTAYETGGVYGKPVLITPLSKKGYEEIGNMAKKEDDIEYIMTTVRAAYRSNIQIWGIDEIQEKLLELYEDMDWRDRR